MGWDLRNRGSISDRDFSLPQGPDRIWGPISADERWVGIRYRLPGPSGTEGGPGHDNVAYIFASVVSFSVDCTN